jgi:protein-tyrosine phosphatase
VRFAGSAGPVWQSSEKQIENRTKRMRKKLAIAGLMAAGVLAQAEVTQPVCEQVGPDQYRVTFTLTGDSHKVKIFSSEDADGKRGRKLLKETASSDVTVLAGKPGERVYFFLEPDHGGAREVSIRLIPLEGTPNFRDLGGYETTDGHFVRWGKIYRAGVLTYLTEKDFAYLGQLGIRVVCDFRTDEENTEAPEKWIPGSGVRQLHLPIGTDASKTLASQQFLTQKRSDAEVSEWMTKGYASFVIDSAPEYARVFAEMKRNELPIAYHCTGGKDRTGVFSALLLLALGVPEKTVAADYELTNRYLAVASQNPNGGGKAMANASRMMANLTPEQRKALMAAKSEYLEGALRAIDEKYGSFDNYRRQALKVSDSDLETLRSKLLVK